MFKIKYLLWLAPVLAFFIIKHLYYQIPEERQKIMLTDPVKSVQDSMLVLQRICESVEPIKFINCAFLEYNSTLMFNTKSLGKFDSVTIFNEGFIGMKRDDAQKVLSIMRFLRRNFISGVWHETTMGCWFFSYRHDKYYSSYTQTRQLYIWTTPQDTLNPVFTYYNEILDRKEHMVLVKSNNVRYRKF